MKFKLLFIFTICSMVAMAQSNTVDNPNLSAADNSATVAIETEPVNYDDEVKIYPTTTEDLIYFKSADTSLKFTITVFDIYGKKHNVEIHKGTININQLNAGIYIIQFTCKKFSITKNVIRK